MKTQRILIVFGLLVIVLALTLGTSVLLSQASSPPTQTRLALVRIEVPAGADLSELATSGVAAYARLSVGEGEALIAGASAETIASLVKRGWEVRVLDEDAASGEYYLVYTGEGGLPDAALAGYGRVLTSDGTQTLLRTTAGQAEALAQRGAELARIGDHEIPVVVPRQHVLPPATVVPDPRVQALMNQVTATWVETMERRISGEEPVSIGGMTYTIRTRYALSPTATALVTQYAYEWLQQRGYEVSYDYFPTSSAHNAATIRNVIGNRPGLTHPEDVFLLVGHIDSISEMSNAYAPGADDNASGTTSLMILSDLLNQLQWGCTLRIVFFNSEEQGLVGSANYVPRLFYGGENVLGVINFDQNGFDSVGGPDMTIRARQQLSGTIVLANRLVDVVNAYSINLIPHIDPMGAAVSDHASFWNWGYSAIHEREWLSDNNPWTHTTQDRLYLTPPRVNFDFVANIIKAGIGTMAHSGCLLPAAPGWMQGSVTSGGAPVAGARLNFAHGASGEVYRTTASASGTYTKTLPAGTYTVSAGAYGYLTATLSNVAVTTGTITMQNIPLTAAPIFTVSGVVTDSVTGAPLAATVAFLGAPVTVQTDPSTGVYSAQVAQGSYTMRVWSPRHHAQRRDVTISGNQSQSFGLAPAGEALLVDDDANQQFQTYYQDALNAVGLTYDTWTVGTTNNPPLDTLSDYRVVIWFTGNDFSTTLNANNWRALRDYLRGGGNLFLTGQDIAFDLRFDPFLSEALHAQLLNDDTNTYDLTGVAFMAGLDVHIEGAGGANNQNYPDELMPLGEAFGIYDYAGAPTWGGLAYDGVGRLVYLGYGFEAIDSAASRESVMERILDWLTTRSLYLPLIVR